MTLPYSRDDVFLPRALMWRGKGQMSHTHSAAHQLLQHGSAPHLASSGVNLLFTPITSPLLLGLYYPP